MNPPKSCCKEVDNCDDTSDPSQIHTEVTLVQVVVVVLCSLITEAILSVIWLVSISFEIFRYNKI